VESLDESPFPQGERAGITDAWGCSWCTSSVSMDVLVHGWQPGMT